jgi:hypothetical protein
MVESFWVVSHGSPVILKNLRLFLLTEQSSKGAKRADGLRGIQTMHIDRVDLILTVPPVALLEERHVSRAADRVDLSRPARRRALQRLPCLFDAPILIRDGPVHK